MSSMPPAAVAADPVESVASTRAPRTRGRRQRSVLASIGLHATLIGATFTALFPILWVVLSSIKPPSEIRRTEIKLFSSPTLANYEQLLTKTDFPTWLLNSVVVAAFTMVFGIAMSATAGYALSRFNFPGKRGIMWIFLLTQSSPWRS